jgi:hypothetical protein
MSSKVHPIRVLWMAGRAAITVAIVVIVWSAITGHDFDPATLRNVRVAMVLLAVVGVLVVLLTGRRASNKAPMTRQWTASASATINRPPRDVWNLIRAAETAPLVDPGIERGSVVAGTPRGVGEQQEFLTRCPDGTLTSGIVEVVAEQPGQWAQVRSVTGPPSLQNYRLTSIPGGTEFSYELTVTALRWSAYHRHPKKLAADAAEKYVANVKRVVEALPGMQV